MQPAPDIVAGWPAAPYHFMMAAAAAEIARPAGSAWRLPVNMPLGEPLRLTRPVDPAGERAHCALRIADKAVTGGKFAIRRHAEIAGPRPARVGSVRAAVNLAHGVDHVGERVALAEMDAPFVLAPAVDHLAEHPFEVVRLHLALSGRGAQHRREPDAVETRGDEIVERPAQRKIRWRNRDAGGHLHGAPQAQERLDAPHDRIETAASALERPERVMELAWSVEADSDGEAVVLEEAGVVLGQQRAVGGDRERHLRAARFGEIARPPGRLAQRVAVDQRLAAEEGEIELGAGFSAFDQQLDRAQRVGFGHRLRRRAELALLGVAIGAAEVALLRDRERQRANRLRLERRVVDQRWPVEADPAEEVFDFA